MSAAARRTTRVWLPLLALASAGWITSWSLTLTMNGLGIVSLLILAACTALAARDGGRAWGQQ